MAVRCAKVRGRHVGRISPSSSQLAESSRVARIASGDGAPATATVSRGGNARLNPERVLVCIDPAKPSSEVIVAGAQLAARVGAIWFAAAVDVSRSSSFMAGQRRPRLLSSDVIAVIEMLGGEVIEVTARDPAAGLIGLCIPGRFHARRVWTTSCLLATPPIQTLCVSAVRNKLTRHARVRSANRNRRASATFSVQRICPSRACRGRRCGGKRCGNRAHRGHARAGSAWNRRHNRDRLVHLARGNPTTRN